MQRFVAGVEIWSRISLFVDAFAENILEMDFLSSQYDTADRSLNVYKGAVG